MLAVLNPLVLLHLIAGAHNDALMLGFLLAGLWYSRVGRPIVGVLLCTIGGMIKIPAFAGVVYIGWGWLGDDASFRSRLRPTLTAAGFGLVVMAAVSQMVGLGWGWVTALGNSATVRSWSDPPTIVGLCSAKVLELLGLGNHQAAVLSGARDLGLLLAAVVSLRLLWRARQATAIRAMGLTLLAVVFLGPAVQPWYVAWSMVVLAVVAEHRLRVLLIVLSTVACFLGLPGAGALVLRFGEANQILIALASLAMLLLLAIPLVMRVRRALNTTEDRVPAVTRGRRRFRQRRRCRRATSTQRPNFRPISRSMPMRSKPHAW